MLSLQAATGCKHDVHVHMPSCMHQNIGDGPADQTWQVHVKLLCVQSPNVIQKGSIDQQSQVSCMQLPLTGTMILILPSTCTGDGPVGGVQSKFCPGVGAGGGQHPVCAGQPGCSRRLQWGSSHQEHKSTGARLQVCQIACHQEHKSTGASLQVCQIACHPEHKPTGARLQVCQIACHHHPCNVDFLACGLTCLQVRQIACCYHSCNIKFLSCGLTCLVS